MSNETMGITSTNPKDRVGLTKPPLELIPPVALIHCARAVGNGAVKYGPYNWRDEKVSARIYVAACLRHVGAWLDREENARDSGVHHLGHAMACLAILLDAQSLGQLSDDRPKAGRTGDVLEEFTSKKPCPDGPVAARPYSETDEIEALQAYLDRQERQAHLREVAEMEMKKDDKLREDAP